MMGLMRGVQEELSLQQKRALQEPMSGTNQGGIGCVCIPLKLYLSQTNLLQRTWVKLLWKV